MKLENQTVQRARNGGGWFVVLLLVLAALLIGGGLLPRLADVDLLDREPTQRDVPAVAQETGQDTPEASALPELPEAADLTEESTEHAAPGDLEAILDAYYAAIDANDLAAALRQASAYVKAAPGDAYGYALRGYAHWLRGRCDSAIVDLDRAIALSPEYGYAYFARGSCRFAMVRLDDAARDAGDAAAFAQTRVEEGYGHALRGWIAYARGRFEEAARAFTEAAMAFEEVGEGGAMARAGLRLSALQDGVPIQGDVPQDMLTDSMEFLVLEVLAGRRTRADLENAEQGDARATFYLAQLALAEGRDEEALELLEVFMRLGFTPDVERAVARVQLISLR